MAMANMNLIGVFVTKLWPVQALACGGDGGGGNGGGTTKNIISPKFSNFGEKIINWLISWQHMAYNDKNILHEGFLYWYYQKHIWVLYVSGITLLCTVKPVFKRHLNIPDSVLILLNERCPFNTCSLTMLTYKI